MENSASQVQASYSFKVEKNGNTHTITYERAKYGPNVILSLLLPAMILSIPLGMVDHGSFGRWIFMTLLFSVGGYIAINYLRKGGSFSISNASFTVDGKEYDKAHIGNLYIKAPNGYEETMPLNNRTSTHAFVFGGDRPTQIGMGAATAVAGAANIVGQAGSLAMQGARKNFHKNRMKVNYSIGFLYGEKEVKLAGGLTENTAQVMLDKVIELSNPVA